MKYVFTSLIVFSTLFAGKPKFTDQQIAGICEANARCTADYMIRKQVTYDHWYKKCVTFTSY